VANPQFLSVSLNGNDDNSTYHTFQPKLTVRPTPGLTGQFTYTWSKALGDTSGSRRDPRNLALQKGLLSFNRTHQINSYATYDLPFGPNRLLLSRASGWIQRVVEGWQISGIAGWTSGAPLGFSTTRNTIGGGTNT